ncbi:hypothetical protein LUZ60_010232 [Juncus effusus]|nr:hypothetical protein LUZ60_010232 [Juncus effusus]
MRVQVHPVASLGKRNVTIRYEGGGATGLRQQKKLRRLPHIFSRVLELPFTADAEVAVEEGPTNFRFIAAADGICADVRAHPIQIHPGVVRIVIRDGLDAPFGQDEAAGVGLDELELDRWRFRLPQCTRPALATADYVDGELIVTVPKDFENDL